MTRGSQEPDPNFPLGAAVQYFIIHHSQWLYDHNLTVDGENQLSLSCPPNLSLEDSAFTPSRMKHGAYLLFIFFLFSIAFFLFFLFFLIIFWLCFLWRILLDKSQILHNAELSFWKPSRSHLQGFLLHTLNQCLTRWRARTFLRLLSLVFSQDIVNVRMCVFFLFTRNS